MSARTFTPVVRTGEVIKPGSLDMLQWSDRWHQLDDRANQAACDADAEALWAERDDIEKQVMAAPCESAAAALAKLRIIMAQVAPGAAFEDAYEYPVFQQVTAWLEGQLP